MMENNNNITSKYIVSSFVKIIGQYSITSVFMYNVLVQYKSLSVVMTIKLDAAFSCTKNQYDSQAHSEYCN